ncbi:MAG: hypothetical protein LBI28_03460 [Treponema sp.]|jgi:hypothetical protein|nr:hypothetical protein [Treponema sp.]
MGTREQTRENVRILLDRIIRFNNSNRSVYRELSSDIDRNYLNANHANNYRSMLSSLENYCNRFGNNDNNDIMINGLSDSNLATLELYLKNTADFIHVDTHDIQIGTGYGVIAEWPTFYYSSVANNMELIPNFMNLSGKHLRWWANPEAVPFPQMSAIDQMIFIRRLYNEGQERGGRVKGAYAALLRGWRRSMNLPSLFSIDEPFMNVELRDFLNVNENGEDRYTLLDMKMPGWREENSIVSVYHQSTASDRRIRIILNRAIVKRTIEINWVYNRLNAKFVNSDGREAVFRHPGIYINNVPDKGTFNYVNAPMRGHWTYDVWPFERNPPRGYTESTTNLYNIGAFGNKHYWVY